jgi:hypothetical protein
VVGRDPGSTASDELVEQIHDVLAGDLGCRPIPPGGQEIPLQHLLVVSSPTLLYPGMVQQIVSRQVAEASSDQRLISEQVEQSLMVLPRDARQNCHQPSGLQQLGGLSPRVDALRHPANRLLPGCHGLCQRKPALSTLRGVSPQKKRALPMIDGTVVGEEERAITGTRDPDIEAWSRGVPIVLLDLLRCDPLQPPVGEPF